VQGGKWLIFGRWGILGGHKIFFGGELVKNWFEKELARHKGEEHGETIWVKWPETQIELCLKGLVLLKALRERLRGSLRAA
jgi:hypothetical protein